MTDPSQNQPIHEDFTFFNITLHRHRTAEKRSWRVGTRTLDMQGYKASLVYVFKSLMWELEKERIPFQYGEWRLEKVERANGEGEGGKNE